MKCVRFILVLLALGLAAEEAHADGGIIRAHEVQGPFLVTVFTAAEPQQGSLVDVSVMVQERDSNDAIVDATVKLAFAPPARSFAAPIEQICGAPEMPGSALYPERFAVKATRQLASNKLLYAAQVKFDAVGLWQLQVFINRGEDSEKITCSIPVSPPPRKLIALFPYLISPPLLIALFALNQWLRGQSRGKLPAQLTLSARPPS
jgi:hypothetical protein